jgi:hypothetical protein
MAVVANVDAYFSDCGLEHRIADVAGTEIKFFPKALDLRNVRLAIFAEILAVVINHRRGVVIDAALVFFVHRHDKHDVVAARDFLH